jgi:hypothetical protein
VFPSGRDKYSLAADACHRGTTTQKSGSDNTSERDNETTGLTPARCFIYLAQTVIHAQPLLPSGKRALVMYANHMHNTSPTNQLCRALPDGKILCRRWSWSQIGPVTSQSPCQQPMPDSPLRPRSHTCARTEVPGFRNVDKAPGAPVIKAAGGVEQFTYAVVESPHRHYASRCELNIKQETKM